MRLDSLEAAKTYENFYERINSIWLLLLEKLRFKNFVFNENAAHGIAYPLPYLSDNLCSRAQAFMLSGGSISPQI